MWLNDRRKGRRIGTSLILPADFGNNSKVVTGMKILFLFMEHNPALDYVKMKVPRPDKYIIDSFGSFPIFLPKPLEECHVCIWRR